MLSLGLARPGLDPRSTSPKKPGDTLSDSKSSLESIAAILFMKKIDLIGQF